jgi:hypothetical protein
MRTTLRSLGFAVAVIALWECLLRPSVNSSSQAQPPKKSPADNEELARLHAEDQADRMPKDGKIDWKTLGPRDAKRLARVHEIYQANQLATGADYYHTAMVLQHSQKPADFLLAHELCIVAVGKGEERAKWLAAASEDRFLMNIGRPQRFGTQYRSNGPNDPVKLYKVEDGVTDALRLAFKAPTLEQAKEREAEMNKIR